MTGEPSFSPEGVGRDAPAGRRAIDRLARRILPHPRDVAFVDMLRSGRDLALGRRPRSLIDAARVIRTEERLRIIMSRQDLSRGDPGAAAAEAAPIERLDPANRIARELRATAGRSEPIRGRASGWPTEEDLVAAQAQLRAEGHLRPVVLLYHQASPDSPFQTLLYRRAWASGIAPLPLHDLADLARIDSMIQPGTGRILHLHWMNRVLAGATGTDDVRRRIDAATAILDAAKEAGWSIVWTVHNILPHDSPLETAEAELRQAIADRAALVHVLASSTAELAAPWFRIPLDRTIHVPLPSFRGAYADIVDRSAARYALGLPGDARVITLIGGLRPYKGLDLLMDAFELAVREHPDLHLLVAGFPSPAAGITAFMDRALAHPNVHLHARVIPSDDMQLFMRASNAVVLPYLRTLNSALLMLALAFDLPVIAPALGGIPETVDPAISTLFPPGDVEALAGALGAVRPNSPETAAIARRICEEHDPDRLSGELMAALRRVVDEATADGGTSEAKAAG